MSWVRRLLGRDAAPPRPARVREDLRVDAAPCPQAPARNVSSAADALRAGNALLAQRRFDDAADRYREAIQADPRSADAHVNLAFALVEGGRRDDALAPLRRAVVLDPASPDGHYLLGSVHLARLELSPAIEHLRRAIALQPALIVAYRDLGRALHDAGQLDAARTALLDGLSVDARQPDLHHFLGNVELRRMRLDEAIASYRNALALQPDDAAVHNNLAQALLNLGDFDAAGREARRALALDPSMHVARSNLLMTLSCDVGQDVDEYLAEARRYGDALGGSRPPQPRPVAVHGDATPRALRVGFVSGDLRAHPVGYFLDNVIAHWSRSAGLETVAYNNHPAHDELTARLQTGFGAWRDIWGADDDTAARLIAADAIDVLVDLSGHTPDNRLPLFARRVAPVQVSWLGYWASTGLPTIDYVLADAVSLPPEHRSQYTETVWYLPDTRLCFTAPCGPDVPDVAPLPAAAAGHVTFGSFQRLTKLNDEVLALWARVLRAVPGARLRLQSAQMTDRSARDRLIRRLADAGVDPSVVDLVRPGTRLDYLAAHREVDIVLDTFPHSGATTTCEALWMGVPTVTLAGRTMLARQGASLLTCAGLGDWVADGGDRYVEIAVRHAGDVAGLARLRAGLRERVAASPLFDAARFAAGFERALRAMWQQRIAGQASAAPSAPPLAPDRCDDRSARLAGRPPPPPLRDFRTR